VPIKFRKFGKFGQKRGTDPCSATKITANVQGGLTSKDPTKTGAKNEQSRHWNMDEVYISWWSKGITYLKVRLKKTHPKKNKKNN
jgi:hypothetical protein